MLRNGKAVLTTDKITEHGEYRFVNFRPSRVAFYSSMKLWFSRFFLCSFSSVTTSAAPPPALQHLYLRRFYVLFNLQRPAEMLERGVREYITK
jgi:hypothetical protein